MLPAVSGERIVIASVAAPWGPIRLAATARGLAAVDQLTSAEEFAGRLRERFGAPPIEAAEAGRDSTAVGHLDRARLALEAFVDGDLSALGDLSVDLEDC